MKFFALPLALLGALLLPRSAGYAADAATATSAASAGPIMAAPAVAAIPAAVPAVVAIARPSPTEVARAEDALNQFLAQADPATKALAARYPGLFAVRPPRVNPAVVPALNPGYRTKHAANLEVAKKGDIDVLFMGDSITDFWRNAGAADNPNPPRAGKAVFDQYYGAMKVANFGISGDTTQGVLYRLKDGEGQGFQPKVIMLLIGTNNAATCSPAEIAEGVGAVVQEMRQDFPAAKILLLAIFPRVDIAASQKKVAEVNPLIAKLDDGKNVFYLDIGSKFLAADGSISKEIMADGLHPTKNGYVIWAEAVKQPLADLMK